MTYEPGDIILVPFPHTDLKRGKLRPALVLSNKSYNDGLDIVACAVTSNLSDAAFSVALEPSEMADGKLPVRSRIKVAKLAGIDKRIIRRRVGRVRPAVMGQVWKELRSLLGMPG